MHKRYKDKNGKALKWEQTPFALGRSYKLTMERFVARLRADMRKQGSRLKDARVIMHSDYQMSLDELNAVASRW